MSQDAGWGSPLSPGGAGRGALRCVPALGVASLRVRGVTPIEGGHGESCLGVMVGNGSRQDHGNGCERRLGVV